MTTDAMAPAMPPTNAIHEDRPLRRTYRTQNTAAFMMASHTKMLVNTTLRTQRVYQITTDPPSEGHKAAYGM
jgi:hypothetical protein